MSGTGHSKHRTKMKHGLQIELRIRLPVSPKELLVQQVN